MIRFLPALLLLLLACKANTQTNSNNTIDIEKIASTKLGNDLEKQPNSSNTFVLFSQKANPQSPTRLVRAIVVETATGKIAAEEAFVPGHIKWVTETSLEIFNMPGMIKKDQTMADFTRTIQLIQPKQ
jgi:hypothetical protein